MKTQSILLAMRKMQTKIRKSYQYILLGKGVLIFLLEDFFLYFNIRSFQSSRANITRNH